jgi:hypothetical protein
MASRVPNPSRPDLDPDYRTSAERQQAQRQAAERAARQQQQQEAADWAAVLEKKRKELQYRGGL